VRKSWAVSALSWSILAGRTGCAGQTDGRCSVSWRCHPLVQDAPLRGVTSPCTPLQPVGKRVAPAYLLVGALIWTHTADILQLTWSSFHLATTNTSIHQHHFLSAPPQDFNPAIFSTENLDPPKCPEAPANAAFPDQSVPAVTRGRRHLI
jgi:hypothetical protein